ncbi:biotin/lipoyl-binding protein [bacterium]|nr:biotin/lipoyl-binding protein [bacterium]
MRRVLFYLTLGIFLISTGYLAFMPQIRQDKPKRGSGGSPTSVAVEVSPVIIRDLEDEGKFSGSLIPKIQFTVVPKISGRLKKLNCDVGDRLKKDQPIAEIEDEEFVQAVVQAEAELAIARASVKESEALLETARRENDRVKAMRLQKVSSDVEVEASLA